MDNFTITNVICVLAGIASYQAFNNRTLFDNLKHYPVAEKRNNEWYRFITSGFIHGSWIHLGINLFVLYQFGNIAEIIYKRALGDTMGAAMYTLMYILALIAADIPSYIKHKDNPQYSAIGASGAVSAVVFVNMVFMPWEYLYLYAIIPIPYVVAGVAYVIYSSWASNNRNDNIGHDAHMYGALFGVLFTLLVIRGSLTTFITRFMEGPHMPSFLF